MTEIRGPFDFTQDKLQSEISTSNPLASTRYALSFFCALLLALCFPADAQQAAKVPRIGYLDVTSSSVASVRIESLLQGLRDLGWVDGQNISIEFRYAEGKPDQLAELAAELVRLKPDVIVVQSNTVARAASTATKTIPIVMADGDDPVTAALWLAWRGRARTSPD
jgi:putative ABC transport system substrate-binding protein